MPHLTTNMVLKKDALEISLRMLSVAGLHPNESFLKNKIVSHIGLTITIVLHSFTTLGFVLGDNDTDSIAKRLEAMMIVDQVFIK